MTVDEINTVNKAIREYKEAVGKMSFHEVNALAKFSVWMLDTLQQEQLDRGYECKHDWRVRFLSDSAVCTKCGAVEKRDCGI